MEEPPDEELPSIRVDTERTLCDVTEGVVVDVVRVGVRDCSMMLLMVLDVGDIVLSSNHGLVLSDNSPIVFVCDDCH